MDSEVLRFGSFELDCRARELREGTRCVRLQDQPFEILRLMLEHPGEVVTREELQQRLWPEGTFVDFEHSLNAAIKRLRASLGDEADQPRFVETVPRRGYRFIAEVKGTAAGRTKAAPPVTTPRLVVLPFSNLSDDSGQEFFSDGLTEELIAQLGPLCRGQVGIIGRWSSMFFKGSLQRAREIAEALHADYLLEGSTRREGARVRITVRLIEGATEAHLWSETYDRTVSDWLSIQSDVASRVARSLLKELVPAARGVVEPDEQPAYQAYLRGRYHWAKPGHTGLQLALECLNEAVRIAPKFAAAQGALARVRLASAEHYHALPRQALVSAREAALCALDIDPTVSEAQAVLADVLRMLDQDWVAAETAYKQALVLNPSNEAAMRSYGLMLALQSRHSEALLLVDEARSLDPLCLATRTTTAWTHYWSRDYEDAIAVCRNTLEMDPEFFAARRVMAAALLQVGRADDAIAELEAALRTSDSHPVLLAGLAHVKALTGAHAEAMSLMARACALKSSRYVPPFHLALGYVGLGQLDAAFSALDRTWDDRDPALGSLAVEPRFDPLRNDPRYVQLLERLNMPMFRDSGSGIRDSERAR